MVFNPGIYIIRSTNPTTGIALNILGGTVTANGVMFYITNSATYDPTTGLPDGNDGDSSPATPTTLVIGSQRGHQCGVARQQFFAAGKFLQPVQRHDYLSAACRLQSRSPSCKRACSAQSSFSGAIYAKWGQALFAGSGTYNVSIVAGTVRLVNVLGMTLAPTALASGGAGRLPCGIEGRRCPTPAYRLSVLLLSLSLLRIVRAHRTGRQWLAPPGRATRRKHPRSVAGCGISSSMRICGSVGPAPRRTSFLDSRARTVNGKDFARLFSPAERDAGGHALRQTLHLPAGSVGLRC